MRCCSRNANGTARRGRVVLAHSPSAFTNQLSASFGSVPLVVSARDALPETLRLAESIADGGTNVVVLLHPSVAPEPVLRPPKSAPTAAHAHTAAAALWGSNLGLIGWLKSLVGGSGEDSNKTTKQKVGAVFVINLARRPDRLASITSQLAAAGLAHFEVVMAVDGSDPLQTARVRVSDVVFRWNTRINGQFDTGHYNRHKPTDIELTPTERACAASHLQVWREVLRRPGMRTALVCEDDAVLVPNFAARLGMLIEQADKASATTQNNETREGEGWDVLYFGYWLPGQDRPDPQPYLYERESKSLDPRAPDLFRPKYAWWLLCYVLTRTGAKKLVDRLPVHAPADDFVAELVLDGTLQAWAAKQPLAHMPERKKSDIHHSITVGEYRGADAEEKNSRKKREPTPAEADANADTDTNAQQEIESSVECE
eukprot:TRINITY_DN25288_c0_g1_i2.p1 TRINITY_DN25288_c0_g1~~TRINITY_DN25288_c0_g1_i2.p1  ORF type:complete len:463 (+),score=60.68 TRINITY_DN25288_c0_g1_i2:107-1390(+)